MNKLDGTFVEVTTKTLYYIDKGIPITEIKSWFDEKEMNKFHAARSAYAIGGTKICTEFRTVKLKTEKQLKGFIHARRLKRIK